MAINWQEEQRRLMEKNKSRINTTYDTAADVINKSRDETIAAAGAQRDATLAAQKQQYRDLHDQAAVQEIVNRRKTNEAMANAGLTDSGLNRTQQTAIALTRGNQDAALTRQQQDARDAINLAHDEMVLQHQNEAAQQLTANEKERNEYLAAVEEMYGENIAAGIAAEAEAKAAEQKLAYENQLKLQQMAMDFYLDQVKEGVDPASAAATTKEYTGVDVGGLSGGKGAGGGTEQPVRTPENTPLAQRQFTKLKDTFNWLGGINNNDEVRDEFGKVYTMKQLYDQLVQAGYDENLAKNYVKELQDMRKGSKNDVAEGYSYVMAQAVPDKNVYTATNNKEDAVMIAGVNSLLQQYQANVITEYEAAEQIKKQLYPNDKEAQRKALTMLGLFDEPTIAVLVNQD